MSVTDQKQPQPSFPVCIYVSLNRISPNCIHRRTFKIPPQGCPMTSDLVLKMWGPGDAIYLESSLCKIYVLCRTFKGLFRFEMTTFICLKGAFLYVLCLTGSMSSQFVYYYLKSTIKCNVTAPYAKCVNMLHTN